MGLNIKALVQKELAEIQMKNEASRYEHFKQLAETLRQEYNEIKLDNNISQFQSFEEYDRPFFPSKMFQKLLENGVFHE